MKTIAALFIIFTGIALLAEDKLLFSDCFKDGDLKSGTRWYSKKSKQAWLLKDNFACPSGSIIFDSLTTSDFKAIEDGIFKLKFTVKFNSAEKSGNNRFSVLMRDKNSHYSGYSVTIAQGTNNNCAIDLILKGKLSSICRMAPKKAYFFEPGKPVEVIFSKSMDGKITFSIAGVIVMEAVNKKFKRFDLVQFQERCKSSEMIQAISNIYLYTNKK